MPVSPKIAAIAWLALAVLASACTSTAATTTTTSATATTTFSSATTTNAPATTTTTTPPATTTTTTPPATTTAAGAATPAFETASCEFTVPEGRSVECGWLAVPADRRAPEGGVIRLHVARFASESENPAPDPVVFLEGGPGGDALEAVPIVFEDSFAHLLAERDVIFFDQRGTGYSEPSLACPELRELGFEMLDDDLPADESVRLQLGAVAECRDRLVAAGVDLDAYTSAASAADLADLRVALGIDEWNVYGTSYGTRLALTALRDHPEGIRSVVLDSVYPPDVDIVGESPANLARALQTLFDGCASQPACADAYPDLASTFYNLLADLDETPIRAPVTDVFTNEVYDAVFNGGTVGSVVFQGLYSADAIPQLPQLIDHVASGDTYELSLLTTAFVANGEFVSIGMQLSVQCFEEAAFTTPGTVAAALDEFPALERIFAASPNIGPALFDVCELWDVGQAGPLENEPVASSVPALVLAGEYDPITPPAWGRQVAALLDDARFVEFPGLGHGPSAADECPQQIVRAFLDVPAAALDTSCVDLMGPPPFTTAGTPPPPVTLGAYREELGASWSGVTPAEWERQAPGVWARMSNGVDQTVLVQQLAPGASPALLLATLGSQFGLGPDPQSVGDYETAAGMWSLYDGVVAGVPASLALLETSDGAAIVVLLTAPSERDQLRSAVFFPVLDAFTAG